VFAQPETLIERHDIATACAIGLELTIPILVDDMENNADRVYNGWPERLYVLSTAGCVVYQGGKGPYGFDPEALHDFLQKYLYPSTD